ncbi:MAG: pyruvate kinase [Candidatus Kapaibacteriales bacterium]
MGPSVAGKEKLLRLIDMGMDAARVNFSHGTHEQHKETIANIRVAAQEYGKPIPILQDLQGPKIRTGKVAGGGVVIEDGQQFTITVDKLELGNSKKVATNYKNLVKEVKAGNTILLDDGYIILQATSVNGSDIVTEVVKGGLLKDKKGIIVPGSSSQAPSLSSKDITDLKFGLQQGVDAVALSFVRSSKDVLELRAAMKIFGKELPIVSKIEREDAYENIEDIIEESTGIMVARGDLGLEMPAESLPIIQKDIIHKCNQWGRPVITATQMLESMISNPRPTRAEATDVANAVLDGTDTVMLSGETSVGKYPFDTVGYMDRIIRNTEKQYPYFNLKYRSLDNEQNLADAIGQASCILADQINAKAIVTYTKSAFTAKNIAHYRPRVPVIAITSDTHVLRRLSLVWGVSPLRIKEEAEEREIFTHLSEILTEVEFIQKGDLRVYVAGLAEGSSMPDNIIKVHQV